MLLSGFRSSSTLDSGAGDAESGGGAAGRLAGCDGSEGGCHLASEIYGIPLILHTFLKK